MATIRLSSFRYFEPATISEVCQLLDAYPEKTRVMAGGVDLIPRIRSGAVTAETVINIQNIPELKYFDFDPGKGLSFGCMNTLHEMELAPELKANYPALHQAVHQITSVQTKCMGTVIGNICLATPATDLGPAMMTYDAELLVSGPSGERREKVCDFYVDYLKSSLKKGEFVTGAFIPATAPGTGVAFMNRVRTHADIAKVCVSVLVQIEGETCRCARIALGSVAATVVRMFDAEDLLCGQPISAELIESASEAVAQALHPITDVRSTAEYRLNMARVLTGRALTKAFERARGNQP